MFDRLNPQKKKELENIYQKTKDVKPEITETKFVENILDDWLKNYQFLDKRYKLNEVKLQNYIKDRLHEVGKTQAQVCRELNINRSYLCQIIAGKYEPSTKLALLLCQALEVPPFKILQLFNIEPLQD